MQLVMQMYFCDMKRNYHRTTAETLIQVYRTGIYLQAMRCVKSRILQMGSHTVRARVCSMQGSDTLFLITPGSHHVSSGSAWLTVVAVVEVMLLCSCTGD